VCLVVFNLPALSWFMSQEVVLYHSFDVGVAKSSSITIMITKAFRFVVTVAKAGAAISHKGVAFFSSLNYLWS